MIAEMLKRIPSWMLLLVSGAILVALGSTTRVTIGENSVRISPPYNLSVIAAGTMLMLVALWASRDREAGERGTATKVEISSIDLDRSGNGLRARVSGTIEPPVQGVRVWLVREHMAQSPGRFHPGHAAALTDKNGEWQQTTYLWPKGTFRIHAVVGGRAAEALFSYYRKAYDHARSIYKAKVDASADNFPGWPFLEDLPPGCTSDFKTVTV